MGKLLTPLWEKLSSICMEHYQLVVFTLGRGERESELYRTVWIPTLYSPGKFVVRTGVKTEPYPSMFFCPAKIGPQFTVSRGQMRSLGSFRPWHVYSIHLPVLKLDPTGFFCGFYLVLLLKGTFSTRQKGLGSWRESLVAKGACSSCRWPDFQFRPIPKSPPTYTRNQK